MIALSIPLALDLLDKGWPRVELQQHQQDSSKEL